MRFRSGRAIRRVAVVGLVVLVVLVGSLTVLTRRNAPVPVTRSGYACAPASTIPAPAPGRRGSLHVEFEGYTARYRARVPAVAPDRVYGLPLRGALEVTNGHATWHLERATRTGDTSIEQLCVVRFSPTSAPSILVEGFTGGAHCCNEPILYRYDERSVRYVKTVDATAKGAHLGVPFDENGGFQPRDVKTHVLLVTADDRFAYRFGCYACTPMPIRLDTVRDGRLVDVTSRYPDLVAKQARSLQTLVTSLVAASTARGENDGGGPFGAVAAWVADECVLQRGADAWRRVLTLQRSGVLSNRQYVEATAERGNFVLTLQHFLDNTGYCAGQLT